MSSYMPLFYLLSLSAAFISFGTSFFADSDISLSTAVSYMFSIARASQRSFFFPFSPSFRLATATVRVVEVVTVVATNVVGGDLYYFSFFVLCVHCLSVG